jgi:hypothetical protein
MKTTARRISLHIGLVLFAGYASASILPQKMFNAAVADGSLILAATVKAEALDNGDLRLEVTGGPIATHAYRIYSEPSHALMLVAMTTTFRASAEGKAWEKANVDVTPQAFATVDTLAGTTVAVDIPPRRIEDWHVTVTILGTWPDGVFEERLISDAGIADPTFHFSTALDPSDTTGDPHHCCQSDGCGQMCIDCSGFGFQCCLVPPNCSINCGINHPCCTHPPPC